MRSLLLIRGRLRRTFGRRLRAVLRAERLVETAVDRAALHVENLVEALLDVVHHRREVVLVECVAALLPELLEKVAEALQPVAHLPAHAALEQIAHGVLQVAEVHQVVGEGFEDLVGIERRNLLRAVPLAVSKCDHVRIPFAASAVGTALCRPRGPCSGAC